MHTFWLLELSESNIYIIIAIYPKLIQILAACVIDISNINYFLYIGRFFDSGMIQSL